MHIQYHKQLFLLCIFLFACLLRSLLASNEKKCVCTFCLFHLLSYCRTNGIFYDLRHDACACKSCVREHLTCHFYFLFMFMLCRSRSRSAFSRRSATFYHQMSEMCPLCRTYVQVLGECFTVSNIFYDCVLRTCMNKRVFSSFSAQFFLF